MVPCRAGGQEGAGNIVGEGGRPQKRGSSCLSSEESDSERENAHSRSHSQQLKSRAFTDCLWMRGSSTGLQAGGHCLPVSTKPSLLSSVTFNR